MTVTSSGSQNLIKSATTSLGVFHWCTAPKEAVTWSSITCSWITGQPPLLPHPCWAAAQAGDWLETPSRTSYRDPPNSCWPIAGSTYYLGHMIGQSLWLQDFWITGVTQRTLIQEKRKKSISRNRKRPGCDNSGFKIGNTRGSQRQRATTKSRWKSEECLAH